MTDRNAAGVFRDYFLFGFIAGFFATIVFHQLTLALLWGLDLAPFPPYSMTLTHPFGIPAVLSLRFELVVVIGRRNNVGYRYQCEEYRRCDHESYFKPMPHSTPLFTAKWDR